jgi:antitoxin component of MazEF toxin-antitoxin module
MLKHLTKHGNSPALVIEKPVLDLLKITAKTQLEVATDGTRLIIEPVKKDKRAEMDAWLKVENKRHASVYKSLSSPQ